MGNAIFRPPTAQPPMNRLKWHLAHVITSWRPRPLQIFINRLILVYPRERGEISREMCVPFFCLILLLHAQRPPGSADFHDQCAIWRRSAASCAFWGLELYKITFGGRLAPKTAPKRISKGKFKPNQKFRKIEATFDCVDQYSPKFIAMRRKIVYTRWFMKKKKILKIQDGGSRHIRFR